MIFWIFSSAAYNKSYEAQHQKSNENSRHISIIEYPYLIKLYLLHIHDDYTEQFLFDTRTSLPNNIWLPIDDEVLQRVTHNFTRDATRINYSKVKRLNE